MSKHYKPLRPAPINLARLIELSNMLEPKQRLLAFGDVLECVVSEWSEQDEFQEYARAHKIDLRNDELLKTVEAAFTFSTPHQQARKALKECLEGTSAQFIDYVLGDPEEHFDDPIESITEAVARYEELRVAIEQLHHLAQFSKPALGNIKQFRHSQHTFYSSGTLEIDAQGRIKFKDSLFREAVEGVEAERIRNCKVCGRVFWAGRLNQQCCSERCSNTFRVRRFRYKTESEKVAETQRRMKREEKQKAAVKQDRTSRLKKGK